MMLDKIHKAILKLLIKYKHKTLSINQIAKKINHAPLTTKKHLGQLEEMGYVYHKEGKGREYGKNN